MFAEHPIIRVFRELFHIHPRLLDTSDLADKYPSIGCKTFGPTDRGAFMGDTMSFMHLTLFLASVSWQAAFKAYHPSRPVTAMRGYERRIERPLMQIVGDDHLALAAPLDYCVTFRERILLYGGKLSKIDAISKYFGTFCE